MHHNSLGLEVGHSLFTIRHTPHTADHGLYAGSALVGRVDDADLGADEVHGLGDGEHLGVRVVGGLEQPRGQAPLHLREGGESRRALTA